MGKCSLDLHFILEALRIRESKCLEHNAFIREERRSPPSPLLALSASLPSMLRGSKGLTHLEDVKSKTSDEQKEAAVT